MKKYILLAVLFAASAILVSCKGSSSSSYERFPLPHIGVWTGVDAANLRGTVAFKENGAGTMEFGGNIYEFNYFFDYSRKPLWLDLIYTREGKLFRAKLIVKFLDENRLKWFTFFTETRPNGFPEKNSAGVMILTRVPSLTKT